MGSVYNKLQIMSLVRVLIQVAVMMISYQFTAVPSAVRKLLREHYEIQSI